MKQGEPLYPFLFVIVMEVLSKMIFAILNKNLLSSFSVGSRSAGAINISHLLFADDSLIFCGANPDHLHNSLFVLML